MPKDELSLEELSAATGMTARNVRAYQTKGLIPPPARSGRRSVYGVEHLQRLQAIERARSRGASLSLIAAHLAAGRALDDDTLIDWGGFRPPDLEEAGPPWATTRDIAPLLARLDVQRDAAAQADIEELMRAGIFRPVEGRVYTGRQLAEILTELQGQGFPLQVALGIAQRALRAATPMAAALKEAVRAVEGTTVTSGQLGEVACCVLRHLISLHLREEEPDE